MTHLVESHKKLMSMNVEFFGSRINKDRTNNEPNNISKHILEVVFVGYVARRWEIAGNRGI